MLERKICPRCSSHSIVCDMNTPDKVVTGLFTQYYRCEDCGYEGTFFPQVSEENEKHLSHVKTDFKQSSQNPNSKFFAALYKAITPIVFFVALYQIFLATEYRLLGLAFFLPLSLAMYLTHYQKDFLNKHKFLKLVVIIIYVANITLIPLITFFHII